MTPEALQDVFLHRFFFPSFCKKYLVEAEDVEAMEESDEENKVGLDATYRSVNCTHCNSEIGGSLDFTNFFQAMLSKKSSRKSSTTKVMI